MSWQKITKYMEMLDADGLLRKSQTCPDCSVAPGEPHEPGCDIEHCSHCGRQALMCGDERHDPLFARWTGFWPGYLECVGLGMVVSFEDGYLSADLNQFMSSGLYKQFFIKPEEV